MDIVENTVKPDSDQYKDIIDWKPEINFENNNTVNKKNDIESGSAHNDERTNVKTDNVEATTTVSDHDVTRSLSIHPRYYFRLFIAVYIVSFICIIASIIYFQRDNNESVSAAMSSRLIILSFVLFVFGPLLLPCIVTCGSCPNYINNSYGGDSDYIKTSSETTTNTNQNNIHSSYWYLYFSVFFLGSISLFVVAVVYSAPGWLQICSMVYMFIAPLLFSCCLVGPPPEGDGTSGVNEMMAVTSIVQAF